MQDAVSSRPWSRRRPGLTFTVVVVGAAIMGTVVYIRNAGHEVTTSVTGAVLVSGDGRTLTTPASWTGCEDQPQLVAQESGSTVSLTIRGVSYAQPDQACDDGHVEQLTTTLRSPLGSRSLVDGVGHKAITPLRQQQLASIHYLPAGYAATKDLTPAAVGDPTRWEQDFTGAGPGQYIQLVQLQGHRSPPSGSPVAINGHPGVLQSGNEPGSGAWTLIWIDGGNTLTLLCSPTLGLPEPEVLRIANGVHD
jgi:hypothetical protein